MQMCMIWQLYHCQTIYTHIFFQELLDNVSYRWISILLDERSFYLQLDHMADRTAIRRQRAKIEAKQTDTK